MLSKIFLLHHRDYSFQKRFDYISKRLTEENLNFEIIDLYRPEDIDYENLVSNHLQYTSVYVEQIRGHSYNNFSKKISPQSLSLVLKHIHCWKDQLENNHPYCLILEDDCEIPNYFEKTLNSIMFEVIKEKCDLVMIGSAFDFISPNSLEENKNIYYHPNQKTRCTHAYIISNHCASKMVNGFSNINLPIDFKMNEVIQLESIKVYWYEPGLKQI